MNVAERIIKPTKSGVFRTIFLYTGQGESTLLVIPTGDKKDDYKYVLVDSDLDKEDKEIDLVKLFKDLFASSGELETFINTHPHNDHIGGIKEIYDEIGFTEVWHSNHRPGPKHKDKYEGLEYVINKVGKSNEFHLLSTEKLNTVDNTEAKATSKKLGNIDFQVLSPSEYMCEDISKENQDTRDDRIHEQCGVIKFTYGTEAKSILITGDSDKAAWKDHITEKFKKDLPVNVMSASHHGSNTFFKNGDDDKDPYETHIENINPTYLIISAPKQDDSPYGHPHDDAMELYKKHIDEDGLFHLGSKPYSVIVDIDEDGNLEVTTDEDLIAEYADTPEDDNSNESEKSNNYSNIYIGSQTTRIDDKPMG